MSDFISFTDVELLARYAERCADVERATEHGAREERELELRTERDRMAVEILRRMGEGR